MQIWKFLLLGITGDLAKQKVLPAIAQFADLNKEKVKVKLTGYSRSAPDIQNVLDILNNSSQQKRNSLAEISFVQGEYDNSDFFDQIFNSLEKDERAIVYMAVPPTVLLNFLQNSCPFKDHNIDIIVEKPFGQNYKESRKMLEIISDCKLGKRVHFLDHYNFKTSTFLEKADLSNFKDLKNRKISTISLQLLEDSNIKDRVGYYNQTGALKDMLPHCFSLLIQALKLYRDEVNLEIFENFKLHNLAWGQYNSYLTDTGLEHSNIETYFKIEASVDDMLQEETSGKIDVSFESGKKLGIKKTQIIIDFADGSQLAWKIFPEEILEVISDTQNFSLNLNRNKKLDHTNLFEQLLDNKYNRFVTPAEILVGWWLYQKIIEFRNFKFARPQKYTDDLYPVQTIPEHYTNPKKLTKRYSDAKIDKQEISDLQQSILHNQTPKPEKSKRVQL